MRTVRGADIPRLGAMTVGGCALIDHFSVAGPGDIWKASLSTPKVARGWHSGRGAHIRSRHDNLCLVVVEIARNLAFPTALTGLQPRALDLLLAATRASV